MARRVLVVAALAASMAVAVVVFTRHGTARPPASHADVYSRLAQQLKGHLRPLVPAKTTTKQHAPSIQVPLQQGYSCEVASSNGCSLHPCVKYAVAEVAVPVGPGVPVGPAAPMASSASPSRCSSTAQATPRTIPIASP